MSENEPKVLALLLDEASPTQLRRALAARPQRPVVEIVAPAQVGLLDWYATDEDEAYAHAGELAREAEQEISDDADVREGGPADLDPVMAVADALETFPAEEIVVLGGGDGALESSLRRFGLPVTRLDEAVHHTRWDELRETGRAIMSGRSRATPLVVILSANLTLLVVALLLLMVGFLVLWLI